MSARLEFQLLGPVRAWREDGELNLGSPQQRALLALLLLSDGKHVAAVDAVGALWGGDAPDRRIRVVRTYVSRLRRVLGAGAIVHESGGYRLTAGPHVVDAEAFRQGLAAAREARARGDLPDAAARLRAALSLWRGTPLVGLDGSFFDDQRAWLEQLRAGAHEERLAADIELGAHAEAIAELTVVVAHEPYRERMRELLMLALYRAGRQAEALSSYREIVRILNQELGIAPGPGLRELHRRILGSDPTLLDVPEPVSAVASTRLRPARSGALAGRRRRRRCATCARPVPVRRRQHRC